MKKIYIILIVIGVFAIGGVATALYILNEPVGNTKNKDAVASLTMDSLAYQFKADLNGSKAKYSQKGTEANYLNLTGKLGKMEKDARGIPSLFFTSGDVEIQVSLQEDQAKAAESLKVGDEVKLKAKFNTAGEDEFGDAAISVQLNLGYIVKEF
ncbi:MAG: hypothetical protein SGJ04_00105 [Bacteroidota bacterium]|nr:hypothetical protein [Bacteroidota bacterium]